jgi:hypothetical protein
MIGEELFCFGRMRYRGAGRDRQRIGGRPLIVALRTHEHPFYIPWQWIPYRD